MRITLLADDPPAAEPQYAIRHACNCSIVRDDDRRGDYYLQLLYSLA